MQRLMRLFTILLLFVGAISFTQTVFAENLCKICAHKRALCPNCDLSAQHANRLCDALLDAHDAHQQAEARYRMAKRLNKPEKQRRNAARRVDQTRKDCQEAGKDYQAAKNELDECEKTRCGYDGSNIEDSPQIPPRYYKTCPACQHLADQLANIDRNIDELQAKMEQAEKELKAIEEKHGSLRAHEGMVNELTALGSYIEPKKKQELKEAKTALEKRIKLIRKIRRLQNRINDWLMKRKKILKALEDCTKKCDPMFEEDFPKDRKQAEDDAGKYRKKPKGLYETPWGRGYLPKWDGFYIGATGEQSYKTFKVNDHGNQTEFDGDGYVTIASAGYIRRVDNFFLGVQVDREITADKTYKQHGDPTTTIVDDAEVYNPYWTAYYHQEWTVTGVIMFALNKHIGAYTRLGAEFGKLKIASKTTDEKLKKDINGFFLAFGLTYHVTPQWSLHVEWSHTNFNKWYTHDGIAYQIKKSDLGGGVDFHFHG